MKPEFPLFDGRLFAQAAYGALKGATAAALQLTPGGSAESFAGLTRVEPRSVRKYADHNDAMFIPLDVAADLDRAAGKPIMARALAQLSRCAVSTIEADPHTRVLGAIKETSEAVAAVAQLTQTPGAWGLEDAKAVRSEIRDAIAALAGLDAALSKRIEGSD